MAAPNNANPAAATGVTGNASRRTQQNPTARTPRCTRRLLPQIGNRQHIRQHIIAVISHQRIAVDQQRIQTAKQQQIQKQ
jgi:hypothetical protein